METKLSRPADTPSRLKKNSLHYSCEGRNPAETPPVRSRSLSPSSKGDRKGRIVCFPPRMRGVSGFSGFTLVELIVVMTILVILGTIAFLNLDNLSSGARDSSRISSLTNLKKWLDIYQIKTGTYPIPEGSVTINASGTTILGYQGFAKDQIGGLANMSKGGTIDPSDATISTTYSVNVTQTKMQTMVFLEDASSVTALNHTPTPGEDETFVRWFPSLMPTTFASVASDYSQRIPRSIGDLLGILLDSSSGATKNQPIQEFLTASFTGIDIMNTTESYTAYLGNKTTDMISGTGIVLQYLRDSYTNRLVCPFIPIVTDVDNNVYNTVLVGTQCWMASNLRTTKKPDGSPITKWPSAQWATGWTTDLEQYSCPPDSTNTTEDCVSASTYGLLYQWSAAMNVASGSITDGGQGICPSGWHVPRDSDWKTLVESQGWAGCEITTGWQCSNAGSKLAGGGNWLTSTNGIWKDASGTVRAEFGTSGFVVQPSGYRRTNGSYNFRANNAHLWSSTAFDASSAQRRHFHYSMPSVYRNTYSKAYGFSLRCLKD